MQRSTQYPVPQPEQYQCSNCGTMIGRLEVPCIWQEHVVCAPCHVRLSTASAPAQPPPPQMPPPQPTYQAPQPPQPVAYYSPQQAQYGLPLAPRPYKDTLFATRLIILIVSVAVALMPGGRELGGLLFLIWIVLGVTNIIQKSNWKQKYGDV